MGYLIFNLGGIFGIIGFVMHWLHYKAAMKVVDATADDVDGLLPKELFWRRYQVRAWSKLLYFKKNGTPELQKQAGKALKFEIFSYLFLFSGMALLAIGAANMN